MTDIYDFDGDREQAEFYERHWPSNRKPFFAFSWRGDCVRFPFGLEFERKRRTTGGPDPYAGEEWRLRSRHVSMTLSALVCASFEVKVFGKTFEWREYDWQSMPWLCRKVMDALEYRYDWFMYNEYVEDPYPSFGSFE